MENHIITSVVFSIVGILLGYVSFVVSGITNMPELNLLLVIAGAFGTKYILEYFMKIKEPLNWWLSNGILLCIMIWLIVWTILFNISLSA